MMWRELRASLMFGIACATSPCCTPLLVPLILAVIAGTPTALWMSHHLGWIYGGLTLVSIISLTLSWRWFGQRSALTNVQAAISPIPIIGNAEPDSMHGR